MYNLDSFLDQALTNGQQVLVRSSQRAAAVRLAHAARQLAVGKRVWPTPRVVSVGRWLESLLAESPQRLLTPHEEWLLWLDQAETILGERPRWSVERLADRLRRAAMLASDYAIPWPRLAADPAPESIWLTQATRAVEQAAAASGALARHQLNAAVLAAAATATESQRQRASAQNGGLDPLAPGIAAVQTAWGLSASATAGGASGGQAALGQVMAAEDAEDEIAQVVEWAQACLQHSAEARLLVVVPDLSARRAAFARSFSQRFEPRSWLGAASGDPAVAFEGGLPLADYREVRLALGALQWLTQPVEVALAGDVVESLSPRWGESLVGNRWANRLRGSIRDTIELEEFLRWLDPQAEPGGEAARRALAAWRSARDRLAGPPRSLGQWTAAFTEALDALDWRVTEGADSAVHQIHEAWVALLAAVAQAGAASRSRSARDAVGVLRRLAAREPFAPATGDCPITVTGSVDDPVVHHDGIWVCGLQADVWPAPATLDPLLPWYLQRDARIEQATPDGAAAAARRALSLWGLRTGELRLSYSRKREDAVLVPSPLLEGMPAVPRRNPTGLARRQRDASLQAFAIAGKPALDGFVDERGSAWPTGSPIRGGAAALGHQNECAFRGYARSRLGARYDDAEQPGIDASERGRFLHGVLQRVWGELGALTQLQARSAAELESLILSAAQAQAVVQLPAASRRELPGARSWAREIERAVAVVGRLLDTERARAPFTVQALEREYMLERAGGRLQLRVDRVDRLADGGLAVLDYKTGRARRPLWTGARAEPVQLFAYLAAVEAAEPAARVAALGLVFPGPLEARFHALVDGDTLLPIAKQDTDFAAHREEWLAQLDGLIRGYLEGDAVVNPRASACKHCDLTPLCRRLDFGQPQAGDTGAVDEAADES